MFACVTKYNEALVIENRKIENWYPHVNIIPHVALYEKSPWNYWKCCCLTPKLAAASVDTANMI